jgi:hypothetical protein
MAKILEIRGIAQPCRGSYQLTDLWFSAIRDGLTAADHHETAQGAATNDLIVAFFGELFRPLGTMAASEGGACVRRDLERDLLGKPHAIDRHLNSRPTGRTLAHALT